LANTDSINATKAGSTLGMNIKFVNSSTGDSFVGNIQALIPAVINYGATLYTSMTVSGVTNYGQEITFVVTATDLTNGSYNNGAYNELYFTSNLEAMSGVSVSQQSSDSLVDQTTDVNVFNSEYAVPGAIISYTDDSGATEINAIILGIRSDNATLNIITVNDAGRPITQSLSLITATSPDFDGAIIGALSDMTPPIVVPDPATYVNSATVDGNTVLSLNTLANGETVNDTNLTFKAGRDDGGQYQLFVSDLTVPISFVMDNAPISLNIVGAGTPSVTNIGTTINVSGLTSGNYTITADGVTITINNVAFVQIDVTGLDNGLGDTLGVAFTNSSANPITNDSFDETATIYDASGNVTVFYTRQDGDTLELTFAEGATRNVAATKAVDGGTENVITSPDNTTFNVGDVVVITIAFSA
jgi:hypothetical protein